MFEVKTKENTLYFYENVLVKERALPAERVYARARIEKKPFYLVDGFTSKQFVSQLLERFCRGERWDYLGFTGSLLGIRGKALVRIRSLQSLFKPKDEPTANYIYRCTGSMRLGKTKKNFDLVIKKFLPRDPPNRGNRELGIINVLPPEMVPRVHGALVNHSQIIVSEPQVLAIFMDYVKGRNIGIDLWEIMLKIDRKGRAGKKPDKELEELKLIMEEVSTKVIYPFHQHLHELWRGFKPTMGLSMRAHSWYTEEYQRAMEKLKRVGLLEERDLQRYSMLFEKAWRRILGNIEITEIHGDLMWGQIIRDEKGNLILLDLDEHTVGVPAKDLADLCAANRFLVESLPVKDKDYFREIAEELNKILVDSYKEKAGRWGEQIENSLLVYLALRHLHDAVYHLPIWLEAEEKEVRERHHKYVTLSVEWFKKTMLTLRKRLGGLSKP